MHGPTMNSPRSNSNARSTKTRIETYLFLRFHRGNNNSNARSTKTRIETLLVAINYI